jgi:hypothetical protein
VPQINTIVDTTVGITVLADINAYVLGYYVTRGQLFNGSINCAYATSTGSVTDFDNHQWIDNSSGGSFSAPRLAYMPVGGRNAGRLFSTWNQQGTIWIGELQLALDANSVVSVTGIVQKKSLVGRSTVSDPALVVVGHQVVVAYQQSDSSLDMAISNDVVADPGEFTFTSVGGLGESTSAAPALTAQNGQLFLAWKGSGNNDVSVAGYNLGSNRSFSKTSMLGLTEDGPAITVANGELYLAYLQPVDKHVCTWPQSDWNKVGAKFLGAVSSAPPSLCPSADGTQLVLAWLGVDQPNGHANVEFDSF